MSAWLKCHSQVFDNQKNLDKDGLRRMRNIINAAVTNESGIID
jgi:hypothetical protein